MTQFQSMGATGVSSMRSCRELPPRSTESMPAGYKRHQPLVKDTPISNGSSTSRIMYSRQGKETKFLKKSSQKWSENIWDNQPGRCRVGGEVGGGGAPGAEVPYSSWWRPWWGPSKSTGKQPMKGQPHTGSCDQWEACPGSGAWQDLCTGAARSPCWSMFRVRVCDCKGHPHWNSLFLKDWRPWKGPILEHHVPVGGSPWRTK